MTTAYIFPGQGSQHVGMAKDLYEKSEIALSRFAEAQAILGFDIGQMMFGGTEDDLKRTSVTQPAIFLHSVILAEVLGVKEKAAMMAGHSLGEFSALTAAGALSFADGLKLVSIRANAMQMACDLAPSTMAAIVGLEDAAVEEVCSSVPDVTPANYNSPGQLVISGSVEGIKQAIELAKQRGAKIAKELPVNGAFHSRFMEPARLELAKGIAAAQVLTPTCPIYQNVDARAYTDAATIRENLNKQLTAAVRWTQSVQHMVAAGATQFVEVGPGKVLAGLVKRIDKAAQAEAVDTLV